MAMSPSCSINPRGGSTPPAPGSGVSPPHCSQEIHHDLFQRKVLLRSAHHRPRVSQSHPRSEAQERRFLPGLRHCSAQWSQRRRLICAFRRACIWIGSAAPGAPLHPGSRCREEGDDRVPPRRPVDRYLHLLQGQACWRAGGEPQGPPAVRQLDQGRRQARLQGRTQADRDRRAGPGGQSDIRRTRLAARPGAGVTRACHRSCRRQRCRRSCMGRCRVVLLRKAPSAGPRPLFVSRRPS